MSPALIAPKPKGTDYPEVRVKPFQPNAKQLTLPANVKVGVLLIHGLTGMPNEMKPIARKLQEIGCQVEVPMLAGHGGTKEELLASGWKDWNASARRALDKLCQTCDTVVVGGLSMGGLIGLHLAYDNPKVSGVVALSPTICYDGQNSSPWGILLPLVDIIPFMAHWFYWTEEPPYGLKDARLQKMITKQVEAAKRGGDGTDFGQFRTYAPSLRQLQHLVASTKKIAPKLKTPTLIVHSVEDTLTTPVNAQILYSWLGCKDREIIFMDGCDHVLTLDLKKEEVAHHFAAFTCKVAAQVPGAMPAVATPAAAPVAVG